MPTPIYVNSEYIGIILSNFHLQENATFPVKLPSASVATFMFIRNVSLFVYSLLIKPNEKAQRQMLTIPIESDYCRYFTL